MNSFYTLYKDGKRITSLVVTVHGDNMDEVKAYAKANFEYDKGIEQTAQEHHSMIEAECNQSEEIVAERELRRIETEALALQKAIKELKEEYLLADMQGDEETKQALREEYLALVHEELNNEED